MAHIVVLSQMFDNKQEVSVYQNGECIDNKSVSISDIPTQVEAFTNEYEIDRVYLVGNKDYLQKTFIKMTDKFANNGIEIFMQER